MTEFTMQEKLLQTFKKGNYCLYFNGNYDQTMLYT